MSATLGAWQAELVRSVIFHPHGAVNDALVVWTNVVGSSPDQFNKAPGVAAQSTARGEWQGYVLTIGVQPGRIEVGLTAPDPTPDLPTLLPPIDDIENAAAKAQALAKELTNRFEIVRAAAHLNVVQEVSDQAEGAEKLNQLIGLKLFEPNHRELKYQLNSALPSASIAGAEVNRICTWGTGAQQAINIVVGQGGPSPVQQASIRNVVYLRIDVNNKPLDRPLSAGAPEAHALVDELWGSALKVLKEGKRAV